MTVAAARRLKVADEVWVATALLHREHAGRTDFEANEIKQRAAGERPGQTIAYRNLASVYQHAIEHCVANRPRNTGRYRMLYATGKTRRRLFKPGDSFDRSRDGGKTVPDRSDLPSEYHYLLDWYESDYASTQNRDLEGDAILRLSGVGRESWRDEDPDAYVRRLREGWE